MMMIIQQLLLLLLLPGEISNKYTTSNDVRMIGQKGDWIGEVGRCIIIR